MKVQDLIDAIMMDETRLEYAEVQPISFDKLETTMFQKGLL
jgi:hypothetical protein